VPMPWWPDTKWKQMVSGEICEMCSDAHLATNPYSDLIGSSLSSYTRLSRNQSQPGYSIVIFRRHVSDLSELEPAERASFVEDVVAVSKAISSLFVPVKIDLLMMGHLCPHLHCHVFPQYQEDDPHAPVDLNRQERSLTHAAQQQRLESMRSLIRFT
jgi:diadenosine tetraphosphate (Ap4A) HIT family hydrolase